MTTREFILPHLKCKRCGHQWIPRRPEVPRICPTCKTAYWNVARRQKKWQDSQKTTVANHKTQTESNH